MAQENALLLGLRTMLGMMLGTAASPAQGGSPCAKSGERLSEGQRGESAGTLKTPRPRAACLSSSPSWGLPEPPPFPILSEGALLGDVIPISLLGMQL